MTKKEKYIERLKQLRIDSVTARKLRDELTEKSQSTAEAMFWASRNLNVILLHHVYETKGAEDFFTFKQWKEKGATIIKGSKGYAIWGQPTIRHSRGGKQSKQEEGKEEVGENDFFPMCYVFSDKQVVFSDANKKTERDTKTQKKEQEPQRKELEAMVI